MSNQLTPDARAEVEMFASALSSGDVAARDKLFAAIETIMEENWAFKFNIILEIIRKEIVTNPINGDNTNYHVRVIIEKLQRLIDAGDI